MNIRFAKSVNNYGVSDESATYLIENNKSFQVGLSREGNKKIAWVGFDQFGIRLECTAIVFIDFLYVMHLKPIDAKEDTNEIKARLW
jgi:orotate phosphoribosyltransferase-like protein